MPRCGGFDDSVRHRRLGRVYHNCRRKEGVKSVRFVYLCFSAYHRPSICPFDIIARVPCVDSFERFQCTLIKWSMYYICMRTRVCVSKQITVFWFVSADRSCVDDTFVHCELRLSRLETNTVWRVAKPLKGWNFSTERLMYVCNYVENRGKRFLNLTGFSPSITSKIHISWPYFEISYRTLDLIC